VGDKVVVHAFRRDELMAFDVTLQGDRVPGITLAQAVAGKKSVVLPRPGAL
jgi:predicted metalloprotease with PDZ domain